VNYNKEPYMRNSTLASSKCPLRKEDNYYGVEPIVNMALVRKALKVYENDPLYTSAVTLPEVCSCAK
jgi:hypothetical protein